MFLHTASIRGYTTVPSHILDDNRLSLGAKGLYIQLFYSNKNITSLADITSLTSNTKEELDEYFNELASIGYIVIKDKRCDMVIKPQKKETVDKKINKEEVQEYADTTQEKKKSKYEIMVNIINSYELPVNVKNLLTIYFEKWLNHKGRFAEAADLHGNRVRALIGDLVSFHLNEKDMITCVQNSIDHEYYKFFVPKNEEPKLSQFDKSTITSGSYTEEDIKKIKERAEALKAQGKKGTF